jgi:hypothetical protein
MSDERQGPLGGAAELLLEHLTAAGIQARLGDSGTEGLSVIPMALVPELLPGRPPGSADQPLRMRLRCLVYAGGPASTALSLIDRVLSQHQAYLVPEEVPVQVWQAAGLAPRPGLFFDVPVQFTYAAARPQRVTESLLMQTVSLRTVSGRTVTGGGVPLAGMRVSTLDDLVVAHTDARGNFTLRGVPAGGPLRLFVAGRGLRFSAEIPEARAGETEPAVITCEL